MGGRGKVSEGASKRVGKEEHAQGQEEGGLSAHSGLPAVVGPLLPEVANVHDECAAPGSHRPPQPVRERHLLRVRG